LKWQWAQTTLEQIAHVLVRHFRQIWRPQTEQVIAQLAQTGCFEEQMIISEPFTAVPQLAQFMILFSSIVSAWASDKTLSLAL
jgi:hypothetical protein